MISSNDFKKKIIEPSWDFVSKDYKIKTYYFIPGFFSIVVLTTILLYQVIYTYVVIFGMKRKAFEIILQFFHSKYFAEIIITMVVFFLIYILLVPIFEGGLMKYIDEKHKGKNISRIDAVGYGVSKFLPVFEFNNMFSEFKYMSVLNSYLFLIRFIGLEYIKYLNYAFLAFFILSTIINLLFSYTKYEIVLRNKGVFESLGISKQISIVNLKTTLKLYLLMFFINIRVILNFLVFLFFPVLFALAVSYFTSKIFLTIAIVILTVVFLFFIAILGYLTGVLDVFKIYVWYKAYTLGRETIEKEID